MVVVSLTVLHTRYRVFPPSALGCNELQPLGSLGLEQQQSGDLEASLAVSQTTSWHLCLVPPGSPASTRAIRPLPCRPWYVRRPPPLALPSPGFRSARSAHIGRRYGSRPAAARGVWHRGMSRDL